MSFAILKERIEEIWVKSLDVVENREYIEEAIALLDNGAIRSAAYLDGKWMAEEWVKKSILLYFRLKKSSVIESSYCNYYDKIPLKTSDWQEEDFKMRIVPGAIIRYGSYIGDNCVIMPSFINIGAYIGSGTLIDTWATVGSCAQIGKNCHISGGAGIGGVLEPLQASPVIIEDECFIGARSEIAEGVIIGKGAVIAMGVFLSASTKILNNATGEITYGYISPYSVVIPGSYNDGSSGISKYCAIIIKTVDEGTRKKTAINELLRQ